jgi:DNA polymerase I - 3''-5'' exonuclease and polymerase domains
MSNPLLDVLNELKSGQLKGERRISVLPAHLELSRRTPFLGDLLRQLNPSVKSCFTTSVEMVWITNDNYKESMDAIGSTKAFGIGYLAYDDNGQVNDDPYVARLRYLSFGISSRKAYVADLQVIPFESFVNLLRSKSLKLIYDSLPFLCLMRHLNISIHNVSDIRLLDIVLKCGLGNLKPNLTETIQQYLCEDVSFPQFTHSLTQTDIGLVLAARAAYLFALAEKLYPEIRRLQLEKVAKLEMQSLYSLCEIEYNGMPFSLDRVKEYAKIYQVELDSIALKIHQILDYTVESDEGSFLCKVNLDSEKQVLKALRKVGLDLPNIQDAALSVHKDKHEIVALLIRYNQLSYLVNHIGDSYSRYIHPVTKRIHPEVNPLGTRTSRIIITKPNLQGIKHGINRKLFKAPEGYVFILGDYNQIEVMIYAVLSKDPMLLKDCTGSEDVYTINARLFLNNDSISREDRKKIKPVVLGLIYNMTDLGLCNYSKGFGVEITMKEAATYRTLFFNRYSGVDVYQKELARIATTNRFVESILGRKRCFDTRKVIAKRPDDLSFIDFKALVKSVASHVEIESDTALYTVENESESIKLQELLFELNLSASSELCTPPLGAVYNGVAQMTCVDLIKNASVSTYPLLKNDIQIVNTSHDDLCFLAPQKEAENFAETLKDTMENASFELFKPYKAKVSIKIGEDYELG